MAKAIAIIEFYNPSLKAGVINNNFLTLGALAHYIVLVVIL
jgi:hypothetical protein